VEEEATAETLFHQVRMMEGSPHGLLMLDRELAGRTLSAAPPAE
jgi:ferritin